MKFLWRLLIGYTIVVVMVIGAIVFILSGGSDRVMCYVGDMISELERDLEVKP